MEQMMAYKSVLYKKYRDQNLSLVPGIKEFLQKVSANKKYRLAIGTAGRKSVQEELLEKHGLTQYFEFIVSAGDVTKGKPDPEIYTTAVNKLGLQPGECLVIEDAVNGITAAKAAGCIACGITTGMPKESLVEAGADIVIDSFDALWDTLVIQNITSKAN
jgi:HAD superfamily hydrolase (TIGR01509 family)